MTRARKKERLKEKGYFQGRSEWYLLQRKKNQCSIPLCGPHNKKLQAECVGGISEEHDISTQTWLSAVEKSPFNTVTI